MQICDRKGWTLAYFGSLDMVEKQAWMAWEYQRRRRIDEALSEVYKPNEKGDLFAETVTARFLHVLVTLGGIGG